jgi:hypothetical protein
MYNPADVCRDILNNIISLYYLCYYWIFGLNGLHPTEGLQWLFLKLALSAIGIKEEERLYIDIPYTSKVGMH